MLEKKVKYLDNPKELQTISGGSAVGILGTTLAGATAGVKYCLWGGPYATAACGIGGALAGAGYGMWVGA